MSLMARMRPRGMSAATSASGGEAENIWSLRGLRLLPDRKSGGYQSLGRCSALRAEASDRGQMKEPRRATLPRLFSSKGITQADRGYLTCCYQAPKGKRENLSAPSGRMGTYAFLDKLGL